LSKNTEKKNDEKFDDLLNAVKGKKEKSKSKHKKDSDVNGDGNINGKDDGNIDVNDDSNSTSKDDVSVDVDDNSNDKGNVNSNSDSKDKSKSESNVESKPTISLSKEKTEPKKVKRTYYIYEDEDKKLNELARKTDRDKSELIRIAINFLYDNAETE
jgi:type III secretory pathway component EscV